MHKCSLAIIVTNRDGDAEWPGNEARVSHAAILPGRGGTVSGGEVGQGTEGHSTTGGQVTTGGDVTGGDVTGGDVTGGDVTGNSL